MKFTLQPELANRNIRLIPLREIDFEELYQVASDPEIWAQHPNKDRWRKDIFKTFFDGAIQSKGAFKVVDEITGKTIGSSRFYDYDSANQMLLIGYTFFSRSYWGKGTNTAVKSLMLDYIFNYVSKVQFHIGADNIRSQIAIRRLGAEKIAEQTVAYFGESAKLNHVYEITKENWRLHSND
jgi:RimJ/RimL family protein N-acetyltransferase